MSNNWNRQGTIELGDEEPENEYGWRAVDNKLEPHAARALGTSESSIEYVSADRPASIGFPFEGYEVEFVDGPKYWGEQNDDARCTVRLSPSQDKENSTVYVVFTSVPSGFETN